MGDIRDLRTRLNRAGYHTEEFQVESVARHLVEEATLAKQTKLFDHAALVVDTIGCIYKLASLQTDTESPIRVPLDVITTRRTVRRADQCYFGPAYPSGQLVASLYGPLRIDEFLASPEDLNLQGDIEMVQRFLRRIGVVGEPRNVPISYPFQIPGFAEYILSRLDYPNTVFGTRMESADEANRRLNVTFGGLSLPDRFQELLQKSDPEAILAYALTVGRDHLHAANRGLATFQATQGSERTPRLYPFVNVPDPVFYMLRTQLWVPCDDGKRRTPEQIILSRTGRQVLGRESFQSRLEWQPFIVSEFQRRCYSGNGPPAAWRGVFPRLTSSRRLVSPSFGTPCARSRWKTLRRHLQSSGRKCGSGHQLHIAGRVCP